MSVLTTVSICFTEGVVIIIKVPWGAGNGNASGCFNASNPKHTHIHTYTLSGIHLYIALCLTLGCRGHYFIACVWKIQQEETTGDCMLSLGRFFFLLLDTPSHMSCCQPYRSRLSYRLIKAERWSYLIQNYMALQHAWSLQLSPLPFQNEKHSRGITKVWCFSRSGCSDSHFFSEARFDLHSFCFFCRFFFFIYHYWAMSQMTHSVLRLYIVYGLYMDLSREETSQVKD